MTFTPAASADTSGRAPSSATRALVFLTTSLAMLGAYYGYDSIGPVAELLSTQLGLSDLQIGWLNAVYSLPNIFLVLIGGVLVDRYGARAVMLSSAALCLGGEALTALDGRFAWMVCGRLLFGIGAETLFVAFLVALSRWFLGRSFAFCVALGLSLGRLGSYLADRSPSFAHSLYERGWQAPLWLAAGVGAISLVAAFIFWLVDRRESARGALERGAVADRIEWQNLLRFPEQYWYVVGLCVAFYAVILPFRSTFAIKYLQHTRGIALEDASRVNSYVFLAAIFATPVFGFLVDNSRRRALLLAMGSLLLPLSFLCLGLPDIELWIPTTLLGISFSFVPAVLWPAAARCVQPHQRGTAYGVMVMLQNTGLTLANVFVGHLNDRNLASVAHPQGYVPMLWFFGLLSLTGFSFAALLQWRTKLT